MGELGSPCSGFAWVDQRDGASVFLATIWALWHLPYALTKGSAMADKPFYAHLLPVFASTILFTWLFNNTRGSILLAILFLAAGNVTVNILPVLVPGVYATGIWGHIVPWIFVGTVLLTEGPRHLSRKIPNGDRLEKSTTTSSESACT